MIHANDKVVLISGATSGIGLAAVKAFCKQGWKVWAGFHRPGAGELTSMPQVTWCHLDVTDQASIEKAINNILKQDGKIDALINNAGYGLIGAEECVTIEQTQQLFDVNFFGVLRLIQAVAPVMRKQQSGHIITLSSCAGIYAYPGLGLYSASKFAVEGLCESLAATLSPWNIKVCLVEPGFVKTDFGINCAIGSRLADEPIYNKLTQATIKTMSKPQGQSPDEVASLLVTIANTAQPDLRYQTNDRIKDYIAEKLIDPTGNEETMRNIQMVQRLIK